MKTGWQDPLSGEIISPDIAGLQEAVGKIEDALDLKVVNATDVPLTEIFISENNRYRIYQAEGKRNWVSNPAPVIKVNGTPVSSGFTINYGGGAVVFEPSLTVADVVTADFSYVTDVSNRLDTQENTLNTHLNNTADAFDEAKTYAVGDYCIYNNALYRCIVAVETAGEWNPDNWVATSVGAEIAAHKADYAKGTMIRIILNVSANSGDGIVSYILGEEYVQSVVSSEYGISFNLKNIPSDAKLSSNFVITSSNGMNIGGNSVEPFIYRRTLNNTLLQLGIKSSPTSTHRPWNTIASGAIQVTIAW